MMFGTSKALLAALAGLLVGALASPPSAAAQEPTSVTGCLSKGADEGSFSIKSDEGKSYGLTSTTVKLDGHVGHKVTVTGSPAELETGAIKNTEGEHAGMARDTAMAHDTGMKHHAGMAHDTGMKAAGAGAGGLNVTTMKMVSAECS